MNGLSRELVGDTIYPFVKEYRRISRAASAKNFFQGFKIIANKKYKSSGKTAREAAFNLDKKLIESGHEPINILKRKV